MENLILDELKDIKSIKPISKEWKDRIEKVYPNLNACATATIDLDGNEVEVFLALQYDEERKHYIKLVVLKFITTAPKVPVINPNGPTDIFYIVESVKFPKPLPALSGLYLRLPDPEEQEIFNNRHKEFIGAQAHLLYIVGFENEPLKDHLYFIGYYKVIGKKTYYYPLVESVYILSNISNEFNLGGWSNWKNVKKDSEEYNKFVDTFPNFPGAKFTPLKYKVQIVEGKNYKVFGLLSYAGIGKHYSFVNLYFHEDFDGNISDVNFK